MTVAAPEEVEQPLGEDVSAIYTGDEDGTMRRQQRREPEVDKKRNMDDECAIGITIMLEGGMELSNRRLEVRRDIAKRLGVDRRQVIIQDITTASDEVRMRVWIVKAPKQERKAHYFQVS